MKFKIFYIWVGLAILLAGCNFNTSMKGNTVTEPLPIMSEEEYLEGLKSSNEAFLAAFDLATETYQDKTSSDKEWYKKNASAMEEFKKTLQLFRNLQPPEKFSEVQQLVMQSMDSYEQAIDIAIKNFKSQNRSGMEGFTEHYEQGANQFNEANALLESLKNATDDAQGITYDDLKTLDALAGIDRESVINNLSEDGKELIGLWGDRFNPNGEFNVGIVLNSDGTYSGYPRGEYPSKDNVMEGTWEYDANIKCLIINNERYYKNGEMKNEMVRAQMIFEILSFKNDELYMRDIETWNAFEYTRGEAE